jgi:hypothetical protein
MVVGVLLCAVLMTALVPGTGQAQTAVDWRERPTRYTIVYFQPEHANTAEQLAGFIDPMVEQMAALHEYTPRRPLLVRLYSSADQYAQSGALAQTPFGQVSSVNLQKQEVALSEPRLRNLTPEQIRNLFRRGLTELMLHDLARGKMPVGFLRGAAQYSEQPSPEVEVNVRLLDKARVERAMLSWADLNQDDRFVASSEVAGAQSYAVVAFMLDRYGLAPWHRFVTALPNAPDYPTALSQAYGRPLTTLESEWQSYLPEYFGGSFKINYFSRYDLGLARSLIQEARYHEARDELEIMAKFVSGAGRATKENDIREMARLVNLGLEGDVLLSQGQATLGAFQYEAAKEIFQQARQRYEDIGATAKITEADQAIAAADSGLTALTQLTDSRRLLGELKYNEARTAAVEAGKAFAALGDEEHYRQSWLILQELNATQTRLAYALGALAVLNVLWAIWRLRGQARRRAVPGVLQ